METFTISDTMHVNAPIDRCFLLSTSIDLVALTLEMRPVSGKMSGLIEADDQLIWRGWKFGLPQMHETLITAYDRPHHFQDTMGRGRFKRFQHDHFFDEVGGQTLLRDKVRFQMPFGWAGELAGSKIMVPHVASLVHRRFKILKQLAEGEGWQQYLPNDSPGVED